MPFSQCRTKTQLLKSHRLDHAFIGLSDDVVANTLKKGYTFFFVGSELQRVWKNQFLLKNFTN